MSRERISVDFGDVSPEAQSQIRIRDCPCAPDPPSPPGVNFPATVICGDRPASRNALKFGIATLAGTPDVPISVQAQVLGEPPIPLVIAGAPAKRTSGVSLTHLP